MVGRHTVPPLAPALRKEQKWPCHDLPLFMGVNLIPNRVDNANALVTERISGIQLEPARSEYVVRVLAGSVFP